MNLLFTTGPPRKGSPFHYDANIGDNQGLLRATTYGAGLDHNGNIGLLNSA